MRIDRLRSGATYVGWSDFLTCEEWSEHCAWMFDPTKGECMDGTVKERAKKLGMTCVAASCFEHGPGFLFENDTPASLEERAKKLYPQLV